MDPLNTTEQRLDALEMLMREHRHNVIDTTSRIDSFGTVVQSLATASSVTPRSEDDFIDITALATGLTVNNPTGDVKNTKKLIIRIKDNGTARAISFGSMYTPCGVALPTTTVLSKILYLGFIYNTANALNKYQLVSLSQEA